jgi:amino acid transporter
MTAAGTPRRAGRLAQQEKAKLRKVLGRFDLILFTACAIVGLDSVAFAASAGGQAITWLAGSLVLFLIPYGLLTAEAGAAFPYEGGLYQWVKLAFGRLPAAVSAVLYWLSNPIWIGGTLSASAIAALDAFVFKHSIGKWPEIAIGLGFTWLAVIFAVMAFRYGKWGPNVGTLIKACCVGIFLTLVIAFLLSKGHPAGTVGAADLKPTVSGFLSVIGVLVFLWVGFELSNGASEEMRNPRRDVPVMIVGSGVIGAALYGLTIAGMLLVIPKAGLSHVAGFADAYNRVAGVLGSGTSVLGPVFGVLIVLTLLGSGVVWLEGADRTQAVAALDGAAPAWLGKFTRFGTPLNVNIMSGLIGSAFVFFVFWFTHGSLADFFSVMIALAIAVATLGYLFMFPAIAVLRHRYPDVPRPYKVPGGTLVVWLCAIACEAFIVVTGITLLWPGLIDSWLGQAYSMQANWAVPRSFFETTTLSTFAAIIVVGVAFWGVGRRNLRRGIAGDAEATAAPCEPYLSGARAATAAAGTAQRRDAIPQTTGEIGTATSEEHRGTT